MNPTLLLCDCLSPHLWNVFSCGQRGKCCIMALKQGQACAWAWAKSQPQWMQLWLGIGNQGWKGKRCWLQCWLCPSPGHCRLQKPRPVLCLSNCSLFAQQIAQLISTGVSGNTHGTNYCGGSIVKENVLQKDQINPGFVWSGAHSATVFLSHIPIQPPVMLLTGRVTSFLIYIFI